MQLIQFQDPGTLSKNRASVSGSPRFVPRDMLHVWGFNRIFSWLTNGSSNNDLHL